MEDQLKTASIDYLTTILNSVESSSNLRFVYRKAINSIENAAPVTNVREYQKLCGIGPKIVSMLEKYLSEKGIISANLPTLAVNNQAKTQKNVTEPKRIRNYVPKFRSGGYAILLALLRHNNSSGWMSKSEIIAHAAQYCDSSFVYSANKTGSYTAWSSINSLIKHELVEKERNRFSLSDNGIQIANIFQEDLINLPASELVEPLEMNISDYENNVDSGALSNINPKRKFKVQEVRRQSLNMLFNPISLDEDLSNEPIILSKFHRDKEFCKPVKSIPPNAKTLPKNSFDLFLCLDNREVRNRSDRDFFHNELEKCGIPIMKQTLSLGDFCFIAKDKQTKEMYVLGILIERKCNSDLLSSIKDSRFKEQKHRLAESGHAVIYLVEGYNYQKDIRFSNETKAMQSALVETIVQSDFDLVLTPNAQGTVEYLAELFRIANERYWKDLVVGENQNKWDTCIRLDEFNDNHQKTRAMTMNDLWQRQLCTIHGLSKRKASLIAKKYTTMASLLNEFDGKTETQKLQLIMSVGNEITKIGPKLAKSIVDTFC